VAGRGRTLLWGIAVGGALARGFWSVSQDCHAWANSHGYQLLHNDWWAKSRGCVARMPGGDEVLRSEDLGSKSDGLGVAVRDFCRRHLTGNRHDRFRQPASKRLTFALATLRGL
jgi:hypothetical protein